MGQNFVMDKKVGKGNINYASQIHGFQTWMDSGVIFLRQEIPNQLKGRS